MSKLSEEYKNEIQEIFGEIYSKYISLELENIKNTLNADLSSKIKTIETDLIDGISKRPEQIAMKGSITKCDEELNTLTIGFNEQKETIETLVLKVNENKILFENKFNFTKITLWVLLCINLITLVLVFFKL